MVKRHGQIAFMGGAYVFPGGKVDPGEDISRLVNSSLPELSKTPGRERTREETLAIYAAALRELTEEAGVKLSRAEDLIAWAHWITPSREPKRFDTHFFLANMPDDQTPAIDEGESTECAWFPPKEAIAKHERGELHLPPPTMLTLMELAEFATAADAIRSAPSRKIAPVLPKVGAAGESLAIFMPWDPVYVSTDGEGLPNLDRDHPMRSAVTRIVFDGTRWHPRAATSSGGL